MRRNHLRLEVVRPCGCCRIEKTKHKFVARGSGADRLTHSSAVTGQRGPSVTECFVLVVWHFSRDGSLNIAVEYMRSRGVDDDWRSYRFLVVTRVASVAITALDFPAAAPRNDVRRQKTGDVGRAGWSSYFFSLFLFGFPWW